MRAVLGLALPLLVVSWVGAAGPCVGMAATPGEAQTHASQPDTARVHGGHAAAAMQAGAATRADAPMHADTANPAPPPPRSHGACPHCPGTSGPMQDAHAMCGAVHDVSDAKRKPFSFGTDAYKVALPGRAVVDAATPMRARTIRRPVVNVRIPHSKVPLNLRHCVFIL